MRYAFACITILLLCSSLFAQQSSSSHHAGPASEAYEKRVFDAMLEPTATAIEKVPHHAGAIVHFWFRIDPAGRTSQVRVAAERASDRAVQDALAQLIPRLQFSAPPPQVFIEQQHHWYDVVDRVLVLGGH